MTDNTIPFLKKHFPNGAPEGCKRVYDGNVYTVYAWQQKMYDGSTATFESVMRTPSASVIAIVGDKFIIEEQFQPHYSHGFYSLPGGRVDSGEDPLHAAQRELLEESGYESSSWKLWKKWEGTVYIQWESYIYIARDCKKVAKQNLDPGEKIQNKLVSFDEFLEYVLSEKYRDIASKFYILDILAKKNGREKLKKILLG